MENKASYFITIRALPGMWGSSCIVALRGNYHPSFTGRWHQRDMLSDTKSMEVILHRASVAVGCCGVKNFLDISPVTDLEPEFKSSRWESMTRASALDLIAGPCLLSAVSNISPVFWMNLWIFQYLLAWVCNGVAKSWVLPWMFTTGSFVETS